MVELGGSLLGDGVTYYLQISSKWEKLPSISFLITLNVLIFAHFADLSLIRESLSTRKKVKLVIRES